MMFNYFKSISSSKHVQGTISVKEFLKWIKNGNKFLPIIEKARFLLEGGYKEDYLTIKKRKITTVCLNFLYNEIRSNSTIIKSTGYLYLDIDNEDNIPLDNTFIFASWKSLSGNGRGILVKVEGINVSNFEYNYKLLSNELQINSDYNAAKPTQITVVSHDKDLFINEDSNTWLAKEKVPQNSEKENRYNIVDTVLGQYRLERLIFDNLQEFVAKLDFEDKDIYDFGEPVFLNKVYRGYNIPEGKRYSTLNGQGYQLRCLNKNISEEQLSSYMFTQNRFFCKPPLPENEVYQIIHNLLAIPEQNLKPLPNWRRRYFFNPNSELDNRDKRSLLMKEINRRRRLKSINRIEATIENWNFNCRGNITNKKLVSESGLSKNTVEKYVKFFREDIDSRNDNYKNLENRQPP